MNLQRVLSDCRDAFGDPPRRIGFWEYATYLWMPRPSWARGGDELGRLFQFQKRLLRDGEVVWGHIVQVNSMLFQPGPYDHPGDVVFCFDSDRRGDLDELTDVAHRLFSLKGTDPRDGAEFRIADHLTNERTRSYGIPVPTSVSPKLKCFLSTTFFRRKHLPSRCMSSPLIPLLANPDKPHFVMVLPSRFWPDNFIEAWSGGLGR